jgi:hypothetical protein
MSRWAIAPVFQLLDIRREPGLSPFGTQFISLEDSYRCVQSNGLTSLAKFSVKRMSLDLPCQACLSIISD